jgi:hypothetical protein
MIVGVAIVAASRRSIGPVVCVATPKKNGLEKKTLLLLTRPTRTSIERDSLDGLSLWDSLDLPILFYKQTEASSDEEEERPPSKESSIKTARPLHHTPTHQATLEEEEEDRKE